MRRFFTVLFALLLLPAALQATSGTDNRLKGVMEKHDLDGTDYEIMESVFFKGHTYVLQRYLSGMRCRLIQMEQLDNGLLDWGDYKDEEITGGGLTDATAVAWGDKLVTFHKYPGSDWEIHQRCYHLDDEGKLCQENWHQIGLEGSLGHESAGKYLKAVVFKGKLYLFYLYDSGVDQYISYFVSEDYDMMEKDIDRPIRFTGYGYVCLSDGRKPIFDNDKYDTWDIATWNAVVPSPSGEGWEEVEYLVLARVHEKKLHIYQWNGQGAWSYQCKEGFPDECYSLKMLQGAIDYNDMAWNDGNDNPLQIFFSDRHDGIRVTQYTPHDLNTGWFDDGHPYTGLPECRFGVSMTTEPLDSPIANEPQYRNYIHLVGGRETHCMFSSRFRSNYARCSAMERKIDFRTIAEYPELEPLRDLISLSMVVEGCPPTTLENDDQINAISTVTGASDITISYSTTEGTESSYDVDFSLKVGVGFVKDDMLEVLPSIGYAHKYNHTKSRSTTITEERTHHFKSVSQKDDCLLFYTVPTMCLQTMALYRPDDQWTPVSNYPENYSLFNTLNSISSATVSLGELLAIDVDGPLKNWDDRFGCRELQMCASMGAVNEICYTYPATYKEGCNSSYTDKRSTTHGVTFDLDFLLKLGGLFNKKGGLKIKADASAKWMWTGTESTTFDKSLHVSYYSADLGREDLGHYDVDFVALGTQLEGEHLTSYNISLAKDYYARLRNMRLPAEMGGFPVIGESDNPVIIAYRPTLLLHPDLSDHKPLLAGINRPDLTKKAEWYGYKNDATPKKIKITSSHLGADDWAVAMTRDQKDGLKLADAVWSVYDTASGVTTLEFNVIPGEEIFVGVAMRELQGNPGAVDGEFFVAIEDNAGTDAVFDGLSTVPALIGTDGDGITVTALGTSPVETAVYNLDGSLVRRLTVDGKARIALPAGRMYIVRITTPDKVFTTKAFVCR